MVFLKGRFILLKLLGIVRAVFRIVFLSRDQITDTINSHTHKLRQVDLAGILLALLAAILLATGGVIIQIGVVDIDPIYANLVRMGCGSIMMLPLFTAVQKRGQGIRAPKAAYMIALAIFFGWFLESLSWVVIIKNMGATVASVLISTSPIFALLFSVKLLDEGIRWKGIVGTLITVVGVWLVILGI